MTRAEFLAAYPEFGSAPVALVDATLARALLSIGELYGDHAEEAQGLLCAHLLALSPFGQNARLSSKGVSNWGPQFDDLTARVVCGIRNFGTEPT